MKKIIEFARLKMNVKEIHACISVDNERSIKLVEKLGFKLTGSISEIFRGVEYPHNIYSLN